jgi:hypothetical protein
MEDVLEIYKRPYDPKQPQVCMDETSKQLLADMREPIPAKLGSPERFDYEYKREGVANLFMFFEPLAGKRHVKVTEQRTRKDWAVAMKELSDVYYPDADVIVVVMDNLNTHLPASFYAAFEPQEALRLVNRFEFHYTPKHGSWLNMAEIELRGCEFIYKIPIILINCDRLPRKTWRKILLVLQYRKTYRL